MATTNKTLSIILRTKDAATKPIRGVLKSLKSVGTVLRTVQRSITSSAKGMFRALTSIKGLVVAFAAIQIGRKIIGDLTMFEEKAAEVATLIGGLGRDQIQTLSEDIRRSAVRGAQSFEDEFKAAYDAISAGVEARELITFLDTANVLATAGVTDVGTAVDLLTTTMNAYGLETSQATDLSDIFFVGVRKGKTTIEEQARFLFQVASNANAAGVSIDQVTAANAALTASGTPTRVAMTQMRAMLVEMGKAGSGVDRVFRQTAGVGFRDFMAQGNNMADVMTVLQEATRGTKLQVGDLFASIEGGMAAQVLAGAGFDLLSESLVAMENRAGATQEAYETMSSTLAFVVREMKAAVSDLLATLLEPLRDPAKKVIKFVSEMSQALREVFRAIGDGGEMRERAKKLVFGIFDDLVGIVQIAIKGLVTIGAITMVALVVPVAIIVGRKAGAQAAKAMVLAYLNGIEAIGNFLDNKLGFSLQLDGLAASVATLTNMKIDNVFGTGALDQIKAIDGAMKEVADQVVPLFDQVQTGIGGRVGSLSTKVDGLVNIAGPGIQLVVDAAEQAEEAVGKVTEKSRWTEFVDGIKAGASAFRENVGTAAQFAQRAVVSVANAFATNLTSAIFAAIDGTKSFGQAMKDMLRDTLRMVSELIVQFLIMRAIAGVFAPAAGGGAPAASPTIFGPPIPGGRTGGLFTGRAFEFAGGGIVPGPNINRDIMPALLAPGEGVINRAAMAAIGVARFQQLNRGDVGSIRAGGGIALTLNQTVYVQGKVDDRALDDIEKRSKAGMLDALRSDPRFREQVRAYINAG